MNQIICQNAVSATCNYVHGNIELFSLTPLKFRKWTLPIVFCKQSLVDKHLSPLCCNRVYSSIRSWKFGVAVKLDSFVESEAGTRGRATFEGHVTPWHNNVTRVCRVSKRYVCGAYNRERVRYIATKKKKKIEKV